MRDATRTAATPVRRGRRGRVAVLAVAATVLAACGGATPLVEGDVPVAVAEPVPLESTALSPHPTPSPTPEAPPDPSGDQDAAEDTAASPDPAPGPSAADAAAFVAGEAVAGLDGSEHVVVDLDGDDRPEVVATGTRERVGIVRVAWWTSSGYEVLASDEAGHGRDVIDLRAADLNDDDRTELLVVVEGEGRKSLAVWRVAGRGELERLEADGGCNDGRHVFGVTTARLQSGGDGPPMIVADCDESPLPVADWSDHRWVWQDGAYRHVEVDRPGPDQEPGEDRGRGRGNGEPPGDGRGGGPGEGPGNSGRGSEEAADEGRPPQD